MPTQCICGIHHNGYVTDDQEEQYVPKHHEHNISRILVQQSRMAVDNVDTHTTYKFRSRLQEGNAMLVTARLMRVKRSALVTDIDSL